MEKKPIKKYTVDNENNETGRVEEPFAGYQTLSERKTDRLPCQESIEDMRAGVERATRRYFDGQKGYISHEEVKAQFRR